MTILRLVLSTALTAAVTCGVSGQAFAQVSLSNPHLTVLGNATPRALPDTTVELFPLSLTMGPIPPKDGSGNAYWPCITGGSNVDCSSIPAGGLVDGTPMHSWPLSTCDASSETAPCGQISFWFEDDDPSTADIEIAFKVKQGSSIIYELPKTSFGPNTYKGQVIVYAANVAFGAGAGNCPKKVTCSAPVAGPVTLTATVLIGADTASISANIDLSSNGASLPGIPDPASAQARISTPRLTAAGKASAPASPTTTTDLFVLSTTMTDLPPLDPAGNAYWPCYTGGGDPDCSSIPTGAVANGYPHYTWPLSTCTASSETSPCGQIIFWFDDESTDPEDISIEITVDQNGSTIYEFPNTDFGPNLYTGQLVYFTADVAFGTGAGNCTGKVKCVTPVAGPVSIAATVSIGSDRASGKATILLSATP